MDILSILQGLAGNHRPIIAVVSEEKMARIREIKMERFINHAKCKEALSRYLVEHLSGIDPNRFATEDNAVIDEAKKAFLETERSDLLRDEFDRLVEEERSELSSIFVAYGLNPSGGFSLDVRTGEIRGEVSANG